MTNTTDLVPAGGVQVVGRTLLTPAIFASKETVDDILAQIRNEAERFKETRDISTPAGRAAIASFAYKIARSKTALDDLGKDVVSDWKAKANGVDAERRRIREDLDALKDDVRAPLDAWEHKDQLRRAEHENALVAMRALSQFSTFQPTCEMIRNRMLELVPYMNRDWQEFSDRAHAIGKSVTDDLGGALLAAEKREAEQAERDRQARELEERERQEREERIAREAAERARAEEAERTAAAERATREAQERLEAAVRAQEEVAERIERDRVAGHTMALARMRSYETVDSQRSSEQLQWSVEALRDLHSRDWQEYAEEAGKAYLSAHMSLSNKLHSARQRDERDRQDREAKIAREAREAEQQRAFEAAEAERLAQEKREANRRIRANVRRKIAAALLPTIRGFDMVQSATVSHERIADAIAEAIVNGEVPNVTVTF